MFKYKAWFKLETGDTMIVSNKSPELLEPAIEELKKKGFEFIKKNY